MSVARSASGEGFRPSRSRRASTNASIGLRTHFASVTAGGAGRTGGMKAQCFCHAAPCPIHARSTSTSRALKGSPRCGIRTLGSVAVTRAISWLCSGSPGTIANRSPRSAFFAPSSVSKRSVAICVPGPWQA